MPASISPTLKRVFKRLREPREGCSLAGRKSLQSEPLSTMPAATAGAKVGSAAWIRLVRRMEDGLDWQDAHMGSREIIVGGGLG